MSDILKARTIQCRFNGSTKPYAYFTDDDSIAVGDQVLVVAPNGNYTSAVHDADGNSVGYLSVVEVASIDETVESVTKVREWVVSKIDLTSWFERKAKQARRDVVEAKIKRALDEARKRLDIATLAKDNPELQALLAELAAA